MIPKNFPELSTHRLVLRALQPSDWEVISFMRSDNEVNKYVKRPSAETKKEALEFIKRIQGNFNSQKGIYWVMTMKNQNTMIGSICLWHFSEDGQKAEVGYDLHPSSQKMGLMDEALKAVISYGFNQLELNQMEAFTHYANENSRKLLVRNNFQLNENREDEDVPDNVIYEISR